MVVKRIILGLGLTVVVASTVIVLAAVAAMSPSSR